MKCDEIHNKSDDLALSLLVIQGHGVKKHTYACPLRYSVL